MSTTETEEKAKSKAMKRAVQRLEDLQGYCRIYKSGWENETQSAFELIEDSIADTLRDLAASQ